MHIIKVGDCEYCDDTGELTLGGETEHLQPQVAKVFLCLANHVGEVVTRNDIMDQAWHHQVISDECLTRCISVIRKMLMRHNSHLHVETLHKRGYRLTCTPVSPFDTAMGNASIRLAAFMTVMVVLAMAF
jgi:DNA-binding winged helix-turn-helix (wHTH) protein